MPGRAVLAEEDDRRERDERSQLRLMESRFRALETQHRAVIGEIRRLTAEQRELSERRHRPQEEVERAYDEHAALGKTLGELRTRREAARRHLEAAVVALREVRLQIPRTDRLRPDRLKKEIADLEHRQQTRALPLDEENALIAQLRERSRELKEAEGRVQVVAEHEKMRKEAEGRVAACEAEVDRLSRAISQSRADRDAKMAFIRSTLEGAGTLVAELREKGKARAELLAKADALGREMDVLDRDARQMIAAARSRRDEARRTVRTFAPRRGAPSEDYLASTAEAQLEELLKRGKITLGG